MAYGPVPSPQTDLNAVERRAQLLDATAGPLGRVPQLVHPNRQETGCRELGGRRCRS